MLLTWILDVTKGLHANTTFELGKPFRPFDQLMGVLPDRSKKIVPPAFRDLMVSPESPIIDFYPRDFELDMNGKKMEWEAVVKIPFIDQKRLLDAIATREHLLSPEEKARNTFGASLKFTYSPDVSYIYPSSFPGIFPDIPQCHCVENIFDMPVMDGLEPYAALVDGVKLGKSALAGFPTLRTLPNYGQLAFHGVNVFQQESRNESMVITLLDSASRSSVELAKARIGKRVYVGYPFLQEGLVLHVSDELFTYATCEGQEEIEAVPHSEPQITEWRRKANSIEGHYSKRLGIITGPVEATLHVHLLKGLRKTDEGATVKEFAELPGQEVEYAMQLIVDDVVNSDPRFIEREALPVEEEYPQGSKAFFLGEFNYGRPVYVTGHEHGKLNGVIVSVKAREPEFGKEHVREAAVHDPYLPSYAVARLLHLNPLVLAKITSSFQVDMDGQRLNLGLNLKFEARKQKVLGYSRRGPSGWEFSQKTINLMAQYMVKFPEFFASLQRNPHNDRYQPTDFYPAEIAISKMKEILAWLKEIESKGFERVPLDAEQLDSSVVKLIEEDANRIAQSEDTIPKKLRGVPRSALLKPSDAEQRLGGQTFTVGDRVVYAQDSGKVPLGARGTVVGTTRTPGAILLDVVFDSSFMSGTTLGERCSPFRGQTVPSFTVINVTNRQLVAGSRAATNQHAQVRPAQRRSAGYGIPIGPNGKGQLREASAPPPLRGSFRNAVGNGHRRGTPSDNHHGDVNGGHGGKAFPIRQHSERGSFRGGGMRGGRGGGYNGVRGGSWGRGGSDGTSYTRTGYIAVRDDDPEVGVVENNPNFKPKSYARVPPPAQDSAPLHSRGRGGFAPRGPTRQRT